ncbi:hypothetical protein [Nonomuraea basaltis]|uniref:hypothetical protein n=1 Tax=Nonomuraea basaltis TaxID=2495887 RepID=UPI00110C6580|nr:hypothetical protein [Nonomuraea basaltis]TMR92771.1 hypothetical protein EJK15_42955 [Nonomuraea basaltis]
MQLVEDALGGEPVGGQLEGLGGTGEDGVAGLMIGATLTELFVSGGGVVLPLVLLMLSAVIAWGRRATTIELWALVRGN